MRAAFKLNHFKGKSKENWEVPKIPTCFATTDNFVKKHFDTRIVINFFSPKMLSYNLAITLKIGKILRYL
jgi:hypothetical protein